MAFMAPLLALLPEALGGAAAATGAAGGLGALGAGAGASALGAGALGTGAALAGEGLGMLGPLMANGAFLSSEAGLGALTGPLMANGAFLSANAVPSMAGNGFLSSLLTPNNVFSGLKGGMDQMNKDRALSIQQQAAIKAPSSSPNLRAGSSTAVKIGMPLARKTSPVEEFAALLRKM